MFIYNLQYVVNTRLFVAKQIGPYESTSVFATLLSDGFKQGRFPDVVVIRLSCFFECKMMDVSDAISGFHHLTPQFLAKAVRRIDVLQIDPATVVRRASLTLASDRDLAFRCRFASLR